MSTNNQIYADVLNVALSMGDLEFLINFWKLSTFLPIKEEIHDQIDAYVPDLAQRLGFVCYEKNFYHFVVNVYDQEMAYEILTTNTDSVVTYLQQGGKERAKKVGKVLCTDTHYQNLDRDKSMDLSRVIGISLILNTDYLLNRYLPFIGSPTQARVLCGAFGPHS